MARGATSQKVIRDEAFAKRLNAVCDDSSDVPPYNRGRLVWIREQMDKRYGVTVSNETVRKWLAGEARPRQDKMRSLAQLLGVDEGWLSLGIASVLTPAEKRQRRVASNGAVNLVAGFIQLGGGSCAVPDNNDPLRFVDLYAILGGRQIRLSVTMIEIDESEAMMMAPNEYEQCQVVGVVSTGPTKADFYLIPTEIIRDHGEHRGEAIEVVADVDGKSIIFDGEPLKRIQDFRRTFSR